MTSMIASAPMKGRRRLAPLVVGVALLGLLAGGVLAGCEQGPAQKVGEKLDNALDTLTGKGPVEKAGEQVDKAVDALKKK